MHYAIVTETYPPEVNGVALTVQSLEDGLRSRGHAVSLVRPGQPGIHCEAKGETLVSSLPLPRYAGLRAGLPCTKKLLRLWRNSNPDAIYIATEGPLGWSALRASTKLGIPVASGFHTRFDEYMREYGFPWLSPLAMRWLRRFHNDSDATIVPTGELAEFLKANGFRNVRQLPRAVDTQLFDPLRRDRSLRAEWGLNDRSLAVIHVGRIAAEKNLALAVRAFRKLQGDCPGARFVWVGDGPLRKELQAKNPDFIFCGLQRGESLARHFASADLFLFPSKTETFGNVTLEAMASGVPTVAFHHGSAREHLYGGLNGLSVSTDNDDEFIEAAIRLAMDEPLRHLMRLASRSTVQHLTPERVAADFDALLSGLAIEGKQHARLAAA